MLHQSVILMFYDFDTEKTYSDTSCCAPMLDKSVTERHHGPDISNLCDKMALTLMHEL